MSRRILLIVMITSLLFIGYAPAVVEASGLENNTNISGLPISSDNNESSQLRFSTERATQTTTTVEVNQSVIQMTTYVSRHQTDGVVGVQIEVSVPANLGSMNISVPQTLTIEKTTGFEPTGVQRYRWERNGSKATQTLTLSGTYNVTQESSFRGLDFGDAGEWVLLERPDLRTSWRYYGDPPIYRETLALANDTKGYAGNRVAYLGDVETETVTRNGQQLRVVVGPTVDFDDEERARLLDHLGTANGRIDVGYKDDRVNVFVVGDPIRRGGLALTTRGTDADDFWTNANNFDQAARFSEYVHTRQTFRTQLTPQMDWLIEAMDGYYSAALSRDVDLPRTDFREDVVRDATENASVNLLDPQHDFLADYEKGARVLAALDARIRTRTDGERSFEYVWGRLNAHEGQITYAEFQSIVETVAGEPQDDWLTRSLTTDDLPSIPRDESLYTVYDRDIDPDEDGVSMDREIRAGTDPIQPDTDGDGLADGIELNGTTDPLNADTDGDGLDDGREIELGTNATLADTDSDGLDDGREIELGTNATLADTDGDGLDDGREIELGTNATLTDTDGDGLDDGREVELGTNATLVDTDGDGLEDGREIELGTNATLADTDSDGLDDGREIELGTNATLADTDGDGLDDGREIELGTNATLADTDGDGLDDGREIELGTNATLADTDGDGFDDSTEVTTGSDPADASVTPTATPTLTPKPTATPTQATTTQANTTGFGLFSAVLSLSGLLSVLFVIRVWRRG